MLARIALSVFVVVVCSVSFAFAGQTKTVNEVLSQTSPQEIQYDVIEEGVVPGVKFINKAVRENLVESSCGEPEEGEQYDYHAIATALEVNENYVTFKVGYDSYCGGVHPNAGTYHLTFAAVSGALLKMDAHVPRQAVNFGDKMDWVAYDQYKKELATVMVANMRASNDPNLDDPNGCFADMTEEQKVEEVAYMSPRIEGLGKNKKVIAVTNPPHVNRPCALELSLSFAEVEKFFSATTPMRVWLK